MLSLALMAAEHNLTFDGIWVLDMTRSDVSQQIVIRVVQKPDCLTVIEISRGEYSKAVAKYDYALVNREPSIGKALLFQDSVRHEKWTLSKDARELFIERSIGSDSVRLVFKRSTGVVETR
jgi:hypothetical protein